MRTISAIAIVLLASLAFAQDCNNPLLNFFDIESTGTPQSGADLPFCSSLQNGQTCCSADTVNGFQAKLDGIVDRLNNFFSARDLYLSQLRNSYLDRFNDFLEDINDDHADDLQAIRNSDAGIADQLQGDIDSATQLSGDARDINNQFVSAMSDYQEARTRCYNTALQIHASAWCLACDANYADQGVNDDGTVTFSDGLCEAISDACWPLFNTSARFNPLIRAREAYWRLSAVSRYLNTFSNDNQVVPFNVSEDPYNPLPTQLAVDVPDEWIAGAEESSAAGQCTDLWQGDGFLAQLLEIGAPGVLAEDENIEAPVIEEDNVDGNGEILVDVENGEVQVAIVDDDGNVQDTGVASTRLLQDILAGENGIWAPDFTATGLNFDNLRFDPGDFFGVGDRTNSDVTDDTDDNNNNNTDVVVNPDSGNDVVVNPDSTDDVVVNTP